MDRSTQQRGHGRAALIVNTRSRSGERVFFRALDRLQELNVPLGATYPIRDPVRLPETVREVLSDGSGYETLILGGGDGSVSSVVDFLAHHHVTLGLLPLGTANDFARTLDIPSEVDGACDTVANGKVVDVDLGLAGDNYFVNVASVGLGVGATQALTPWAKKTIGALAYPVAAIKAFMTHEPFSARLVFPDGDHETVEHDRLLQVAVGNGKFYGGGMVVAPGSGIDDKSLDVYAIQLGRHRDMFGVARYLKSGDFIRNESVSQYRTTRVRLETDPELSVNIDGELVARTPQDFSVAGNALKVIVPQSSTAARRDHE
ncbi:lipid kinase [Rubrobacter tropicus]|uniref:Lipid kinase n=1 Tax=Rubrobacter tropicus TaxID=2653851 RepID=A0A6G8QA06_9ACTN|nr:lipid kinase [Rubrobacter tropicus]QIN83258.1 lipid kinase [Rubrobacter tropicus]